MCPHKARVSEVEVRPSTTATGESSKPTNEDVQPQAASERNTDSDGLIESQIEMLIKWSILAEIMMFLN